LDKIRLGCLIKIGISSFKKYFPMKNKEFFIKILLFRKNYMIVVTEIIAKSPAENAILPRYFSVRQVTPWMVSGLSGLP
jgi:hypothetical protein